METLKTITSTLGYLILSLAAGFLSITSPVLMSVIFSIVAILISTKLILVAFDKNRMTSMLDVARAFLFELGLNLSLASYIVGYSSPLIAAALAVFGMIAIVGFLALFIVIWMLKQDNKEVL